MNDDPYLALLQGVPQGTDPRMLADKLRGQDARTSLAQLSADPVLMQYGRNQAQRDSAGALSLSRGIRERDRMAQQQEQSKLQRALTQQHYDALASSREESSKLQRARDAESKRFHEAEENRWNEDREARLEEARIRAAAKGSAGKAIPKHLQDTLAGAGDEVKIMNELYQEIDKVAPGQESVPGMSTAKNWLASRYGIGSDEAIEKSEWWNKFNRQWNIVKRNEKFGATLSVNEKRDWESATINPEMKMEQLKKIMDIMRRHAYYVRDKRTAAAIASGLYNSQEVGILAGIEEYPTPDFSGVALEPDPAVPDLPPAQMSDPQSRTGKMFNAKTGQWE